MPLHPTSPTTERILVIGPAGGGKTTGWMNIAKVAAQTKSDAKFYVLDTDDAVGRMLASYPSLNLHLYPCLDWKAYKAALDAIAPVVRPQDWIVVDFIGAAWSAVQEWYIEEIFGMSQEDYFLQARKVLKAGATQMNPLDGWVDWNVINPQYKNWEKRLLFKTNCNKYCTSAAEALSDARKPTEESSLRSLFLRFGIKPDGQKHLAFKFHTILIAQRGARGEYTLTTVKDRERVELSGADVASFAKTYLVDVAGWRLV